MDANFITGTGTDIGKTWLACALLRRWRAQGLRAHGLKPVLSGFDPARAGESDAGLMLDALGWRIDAGSLDAISPWRFTAPLSPDMAAALEGRSIPFKELVDFTRRGASADFDTMLVEGVGGAMVPLDGSHTVRDWIAASGLPALLVSGSYLGSLSHTLTAVQALAAADVRISAIAVNESFGSTVSLDATLKSLNRHAGDVRTIGIRRVDPAAGIAELAELLLKPG